MLNQKECVFCHKEKIITDFIYEDEMVLAFMDMEPINEGHILLVTKEHYLDADEIPDEILAHLMIVAKKIISVLKEIYKGWLSSDDKKEVNAEIAKNIRDRMLNCP